MKKMLCEMGVFAGTLKQLFDDTDFNRLINEVDTYFIDEYEITNEITDDYESFVEYLQTYDDNDILFISFNKISGDVGEVANDTRMALVTKLIIDENLADGNQDEAIDLAMRKMIIG